MKILDVVKGLLSKGLLAPTNNGKPAELVLNDFLPGTQFRHAKTYGHSWEWSYALAVELEHGRDRGMNVTMNHPLLTGLVVLAHLAEDRLYYARLMVMESEGELFNAQLERQPHPVVLDALARLAAAGSASTSASPRSSPTPEDAAATLSAPWRPVGRRRRRSPGPGCPGWSRRCRAR